MSERIQIPPEMPPRPDPWALLDQLGRALRRIRDLAANRQRIDGGTLDEADAALAAWRRARGESGGES